MNDLENRCLEFSIKIRLLIRELPRNSSNLEDVKQVIRSSGSIGANYIEANESLGDKDKIMKLRISRKEAKETVYWLTILERTNTEMNVEIKNLKNEAEELRKIFSAIILKLSSKK